MILPATTADSAHQHGRGLLPCGLAARDQALLAVIAVAFFLSGMAALVYQVAWQRILALHTGVGVYSVAAIVASFLGGLGAGSLAGGLLSSRVSARQALRVFAYLELAIGLFGAASCRIYYDWLYLESAWLYAVPLRAALLHFLGLLIPTGLMGMSLPFLARALVWDTAHAGKVVGLLYGINMLGAGAGSLLTPWVFMRFLGVRGAVVAAVVSNLLAAACALGIGLLRPPPAADVPPVVETDPRRLRSERRPFALWVALYGLSGFCALSLEIVWFRLVDVAAKSSAFTFGTVLAVYLFGSALGSLIGASVVDRLSRPLRSFLLMQCLLLAYSGAVVLLLVVTPTEAPLYRWFFAYWRQPEGFRPGGMGEARTLLRLYVILPILLYGLPTFLMGLSFPVLQRAVHDDPRTSGRKVGLLQAANIAGCVGGSRAPCACCWFSAWPLPPSASGSAACGRV